MPFEASPHITGLSLPSPAAYVYRRHCFVKIFGRSALHVADRHIFVPMISLAGRRAPFAPLRHGACQLCQLECTITHPRAWE